MAATSTYKCKCCGEPFKARIADRNRDWARYCSKSCKAITQMHSNSRPNKTYPRHDSLSEMKHKFCADCGEKAVNGLRMPNGRIEWFCERHMVENNVHPFNSEALGQWTD